VVSKGLVEAEDITGKGWGVIVDRRLSHRRPGALDREHVHAWAAREHLPPRPLEEAEKRRLVQVAEGIAFVGIHGQVDLECNHGGRYVRVLDRARQGT